jgi:hypothetical protein
MQCFVVENARIVMAEDFPDSSVGQVIASLRKKLEKRPVSCGGFEVWSLTRRLYKTERIGCFRRASMWNPALALVRQLSVA